MKQCPNCRTTYTDDTLSFCLADGARLDPVPRDQPTFVRSGPSDRASETVALGERGRTRIDIPGEKADANRSPVAAPVQVQKNSGILKIVAVFGVLLLLAVLGVGAGLFLYFNAMQAPPVANMNKAVTPAPTISPRGGSDTDELRDQIANLQRQLDEQKKNNNKGQGSVPLTMPNPSSSTTAARANSPTDGFLALRSLPNAEIGDRLAKIPHGSAVTIGACGPVMTRPGKRTGRWCQAKYNGISGWVFDAYLTY